MKYVAAYCLAVLSGNNSPSADDVKKILSSVGVEVDADKLSGLVNSLKGKNIHEVNYRFFFLKKGYCIWTYQSLNYVFRWIILCSKHYNSTS